MMEERKVMGSGKEESVTEEEEERKGLVSAR